MAISYLSISAVCTLTSFIGLLYWMELSLDKLASDGLIGEDFTEPGNTYRAIQLLLNSQATIVLLAIFILNVFVMLLLGLKTIFFVELYSSETHKLLERLINYVIYKGIFLPLVVPPTRFQAGVWTLWLIMLCSLKMFQALARDRLERLNASPSATPKKYFRVYSVLLLVLSIDLLWIKLCLVMHRMLESSMSLLLFYEPLSIAFETLQAIVVHGFQLLDMWSNYSAGNDTPSKRSKLFDISSAGALLEWKGILTRNFGFFLDMMTLLMALGHYLQIWWLHGMAFHIVDAVLFLNIRALLSAIIKRVKGFVRLRKALGALHGALPDATSEEIRAYDDECAICREPMAKAKKLSCNHLFHLACLRSWLDQATNENYSCPTCRKPLQVGGPEGEANAHAADVSTDEQLAHQISSGLNRHNPPHQMLPAGVLPGQMQNSLESGSWRGPGADSSWLHGWSSQVPDEAGPSNGIRPVALGRVQMMMRHLAAVGETYAQTALEDAPWSFWPMNSSQASTSSSSSRGISRSASVRLPASTTRVHRRTSSVASSDNIARMLAMAETVREVLPHIPNELIFQDLQRTNSVAVTVNNLLQM